MNSKRFIFNPSYVYLSVALAVLILAQILFYQFYYSVPITINGQRMDGKKDEPLASYLIKNNKMPKYGRLLDVQGQVIKGKKGNPPVVFVNNKRSNLSHPIKSNDDFRILAGTDKSERITERIEEVQSKLVYKGQGAFIHVVNKGRPGIRMIRKGRISGKTFHSKWLVTPQNFTIERTNIRYKKVIALTFDDGPSRYTSLIMKILREHKAKASFFVVGNLVEKRKIWLKTMAQRKYTIGNHTFSHKLLNKGTTKTIRQELIKTDKEVYKAAGLKTRWVRPPAGVLNSSAINLLLKLDYRIAMWNVDTVDWRRKRPAVIKEAVLKNLKPGQVVLMHDGGGNRMNTTAALPEIIRGIRKAGYQLVTLDELYRLVE